jgi:hypothetical protein
MQMIKIKKKKTSTFHYGLLKLKNMDWCELIEILQFLILT